MPTISPLSGMAEPPVSVMFAVTSSWLIPLAVAIRSLCVHSDPRRNYELHIVHHGLEEEQMKELGKAVSSYPRVSLGFCRLPERLLRILQHRDCGRFSPLTYGRLLAAALFPRHDRVVYLDVDVLLNGDVAELYDADLHGAPIGAVRDCAVLQSISTCNVVMLCRKFIKHCGKTTLNAPHCNAVAFPLQAASRSPQSTASSSSLETSSGIIRSLASASRCITLARSLAGWVSSRGLPVVTTANREA